MSKYQEAFKRLINDDYVDKSGNQNELDIKLIQELVDKATWIPIEERVPKKRNILSYISPMLLGTSKQRCSSWN